MTMKNLIITAGALLGSSILVSACGSPKSTYVAPTEAEESEIYVEPVKGIGEDFIRGVDVSELIAEEESGVKYYGFDGTEQDALKTLSEAGVNYVRIRIWNDPYNEDGKGYGGGNCDLAKAVTLGKRATDYGMKVLIDFHYSDFWADPERQLCPKAWKGMKIDDKADALYDFTYECLKELKKAGVDVGMVQIGNEINNGMSGETNEEKVLTLLKAGAHAVRDFDKAEKTETKIAVHYTDAGDYNWMEYIAESLKELDYDIFAVSYYPYWHGDFEKVKTTLKYIRQNFGKEVMVAEVSYPYTTDNFDGYGNSMDDEAPYEGYASTLQGQASVIRDVAAMVKEADGLGVFYWGGIWIGVGSDSRANEAIWEEHGSGWATKYASKYDKHVGSDYGGCSWDNQALFDNEGRPLPTLKTFRYLTYGTVTEDAIDYVPDYAYEITAGDVFKAPAEIPAVHLDRSKNANVKVTWNEEDVAAVDTSKDGEYEIKGKTEDDRAVKCTVKVSYVNLLLNPGFDETDRSMWTVIAEGEDVTDYQEKAADAHSGDFSLHYWSESPYEFRIEQTVTGLEPGTYKVSVFSQGGDFDDTAEMQLYAVVDGEERFSNFMNSGWVNWKNPRISDLKLTGDTITVGVRVKGNAKSWGTLDDFALSRTN